MAGFTIFSNKYLPIYPLCLLLPLIHFLSLKSSSEEQRRKSLQLASMEPQTLKVSINDQSSNERMYFSIRRDTNIVKLLKSFCENRNVDYGTAHFILNGRRLRRRGTAEEVGIEDGDEIDVMMPAGGGGPST